MECGSLNKMKIFTQKSLNDPLFPQQRQGMCRHDTYIHAFMLTLRKYVHILYVHLRTTNCILQWTPLIHVQPGTLACPESV